jgi:putative transcriptional regulator
MCTIPQTVVETNEFRNQARKLVDQASIDSFIARNPLEGQMIAGTGRARKIRWSMFCNKGKRKGMRVIYYYRNRLTPIFLFTAYGKGQRALAMLTNISYEKRFTSLTSIARRNTMSKLSESLLNGAKEALDFASDNKDKATAHKVKVPENIAVKSIRAKLNLTRAEFAQRFGFSVRTLEKWEQGVRHPDTAARAYLTVIAYNHQVVEEALRQ